MTDYYIKKDENDECHLWLQATITSQTELEVHGHPNHTLYLDTDCTRVASPQPLIGANDEFHTSRDDGTIHIDPASNSSGWSFGARLKTGQGGGQSTFSVPPDPNDTSTSFSVVATKTGETPLELDPIIRFRNSAMQQAGVPRLKTGKLVSAYLEPEVFGAHGICVELAIHFDGRGVGELLLDPNTCSIDRWGDRSGCTRIAVATHRIVVERLPDEDPTGHGRVLYRAIAEPFRGSEVHLVADDTKKLWTLVATPKGGSTVVVPLIPEKSAWKENDVT